MINEIKKIIKEESPFFLMIPAFLWQLIFFAIPLGFVLALSFYVGDGQDLFQSTSLSNFYEILRLSQLYIILRSMLLATVTSFVCLFLAYPVAYFVALYVNRFRFLFLFLLSVPFLINLLVQVYSWFFILERYGVINQLLISMRVISKPIDFLNSYIAIYCVMIHVYLPFMIMPIYSILEKVDKKLLEASADLGAPFRVTFWNIILPISMPGVRAGFFLVYVTSFGEYIIPSLLGGMKKFFVGTLISEYFFIGKDWHVGAAFTCVSCIALLFSALFFHWLFNKVVLRSKLIR